MTYTFLELPDQYELKHTEWIEELRSQAGVLRHKKTGARLLVLSNEDDNKVFQIGFRTPPADSTGVAHIMEHSVLCGSEKYPAKDPFVELMKGSLNTFLNAMTYPDKTVYPVASCNDADFRNLMDIYLDAVFHPNIYLHDEIFRQEGWHYEMEDMDSPLTYNGVVYNEMKGAFSSTEDVISRKIMNSLYPDTTYSVESGGDPERIPDLTYEAFLDFHRKYYHPSNSYIYLYGNMDVAERLRYLDEAYLSAYSKQEVDSAIASQPPFAQPIFGEDVYPVGQEEDTKKASYLAMSWVTPGTDPILVQAMSILEYILLETPGAPVKQALLDAGCGEDIYGVYETDLLQPYFSLVIKKMDPDRSKEIQALVRDTISSLVKNGINRRSLEGTLNSMEFKAREADFGRFPKGLMYGLQLMDSWLYDEDNFLYAIRYREVFDTLRSRLDTGYFEEVLQNWILDNPHASVLLFHPRKGLTTEKEQALTDRLEAYKKSLSEEEVRSIVEATRQLKAYQSEPSSPEALACIPMLSIDDIRREAEPLINEESVYEGMKVLHHDIDTSGIVYVNLIFDVQHISAGEAPCLGILAEALGNMNTDRYSYQQITDEINLYTGGISTNTAANVLKDGKGYRAVFAVSGKALTMNLAKLEEIMRSILTGTDYSDEKRLRDILSQLKSRCEMNLMSSGHAAAMGRATSYFSEGMWFKELTDGIEFYRYISDILDYYEEKKDALIRSLQAVSAKIFRKEYLLADFTCLREDLPAAREAFAALADRLCISPMSEEDRLPRSVGLCDKRREAFTTSGMVQYNACAGNFIQAELSYNGAMIVLRNLLSTDYLWNEIRVKGGAYGAMCGFLTTGDAYFASYRDPHLEDTFEVYESAADYLAEIELDERELTQYIIGAFGSIDQPLTAGARGMRSLNAYLCERSYEELQRNRDQMRETSNETLRAMSAHIRAMVAQNYYCVIGSEQKVMEEKDRFDFVQPLLV